MQCNLCVSAVFVRDILVGRIGSVSCFSSFSEQVCGESRFMIHRFFTSKELGCLWGVFISPFWYSEVGRVLYHMWWWGSVCVCTGWWGRKLYNPQLFLVYDKKKFTDFLQLLAPLLNFILPRSFSLYCFSLSPFFHIVPAPYTFNPNPQGEGSSLLVCCGRC